MLATAGMWFRDIVSNGWENEKKKKEGSDAFKK